MQIALVTGLLCFLLCAGTARGGDAAPQASPSELVDAFKGVFGPQTHGRAIHAKGIVLEGSFTPYEGAKRLSKAAHFQGTTVPVTVRFSSFAGIPAIDDRDPLATPRGLAVRFHLPDGSETDIVTHSFNGFPSATADEFRALLLALGASGPGTPSPTPAEAFMAAHPTAKAFFAGLPPPPVSFGTLAYYGVNSFRFTNAKGQREFGRYQVIPDLGAQLLPAEAVAKASPDYLETEIRERVASGPVTFRLQVQLSGKGDAIENPSVAWPADRRIVALGSLTVTGVVADSDAEERALLFMPSAVIDGIEPADPMIAARSAAYAVSYQRRHP